jgi:hypothetical protein
MMNDENSVLKEKKDAIYCMGKALDQIALIQKSETLPLPLVCDMGRDDIATYLSKDVMFQDRALFDVAKDVSNAVNMEDTKWEETHRSNIVKPITMLLTGPSGLGKNLSVQVLKELFRMNTDYPFAYIEYRLGVFNHETQFSIFTGNSTISVNRSLLDHSDSLYDKLKEATSSYKSHPQVERNGVPQPHIILILFDEIDKADKGILNALNSLLCEGRFHNERGQLYHTPRSIQIIICFTANFGSSAILSNGFNIPSLHYDDLKTLVKKEMNEKGYAKCDISRIGTIIPFFPPNEKQLEIILACIFFKILARRGCLNEIYGTPDYGDTDVHRFIKAFIENNVHNIHSIYDIMRAFDSEISTLFADTFKVFSLQIDKKKLQEPPQLIYGSIPYCDDIQTALGQNVYFKNVFENIEYEGRLTKRIHSQSPIQFLTITHPLVTKISITILPLQTNAIKELYLEKKEALVNDNILSDIRDMKNELFEKFNQMENELNLIKEKIDTLHIDNNVKKMLHKFDNTTVDNSDKPKILKRKKVSNQAKDPQPSKRGKYDHKKGDGNDDEKRTKFNQCDTAGSIDSLVTNPDESKKICAKCHLLLDKKKFSAIIKKKNKEYTVSRSCCNSCRNK